MRIGAMLCLVLAWVAACSSSKPSAPPLVPDGPDMDLDAAIYQDDAGPTGAAL